MMEISVGSLATTIQVYILIFECKSRSSNRSKQTKVLELTMTKLVVLVFPHAPYLGLLCISVSKSGTFVSSKSSFLEELVGNVDKQVYGKYSSF